MWDAWAAMASRVTEMTPPSTAAISTVRTVRRANRALASSTSRPSALTARHATTAMANGSRLKSAETSAVHGPNHVSAKAASEKAQASTKMTVHRRLSPLMRISNRTSSPKTSWV